MPRKATLSYALLAITLFTLVGVGTASGDESGESKAPPILSMNVLFFSPDGTLFIGDGKAGSIWAIDLGERAAYQPTERLGVADIETRIAALLGTRSSEVMIHDIASDPISAEVFLAVSRGRSTWESRWILPNDIAEATILLKVQTDGTLDEVPLAGLPWSRADLPNPVDESKTHPWKTGISLRADTVTDMAFQGNTLLVAGLSNEEFASTLWKIPYPFGESATATTLEVFHGAHGAYETHAPIRAFVPYTLDGKDHLLASYTCTPLVTFESETLTAGAHVKGRTVAEFGAGNYPLDMVVYQKDGADRLLIANSNLPLMLVRPEDIEAYEGSITRETPGYTEGVPYEIRSGVGILQLDKRGDNYMVALQRLPGGTLNLISIGVDWL